MAHIAHPTPCLSVCHELSPAKHSNATVHHANRTQLLNRFADFITLILQRRAQRRALMRLSDAALADIGITRSDAEEEYRKSFFLL